MSVRMARAINRSWFIAPCSVPSSAFSASSSSTMPERFRSGSLPCRLKFVPSAKRSSTTQSTLRKCSRTMGCAFIWTIATKSCPPGFVMRSFRKFPTCSSSAPRKPKPAPSASGTAAKAISARVLWPGWWKPFRRKSIRGPSSRTSSFGSGRCRPRDFLLLAGRPFPRAILYARSRAAFFRRNASGWQPRGREFIRHSGPLPDFRDSRCPYFAQGGFIAERNFRQSDRIRVNERIRAREVRVIDEEGAQLGVMQPFEAVRMARERGLDLVEISPTADPPVCKITDYGKYLYQANKKAHQQRKSSRGSQLKEVKFRPATAEHDYQVRKNQIIRFLGEGHKVRAMIFHRGREMAHQEVGRAKMTRLLGEIGEHGQIETMPRMEGNVLVALLAPKKGAGAPLKAS